jgi:hydroxymethylpyrimidine/phosphomethylpyrimidine kinase
MEKTYTRMLTVAGSDSGGGAGIQADLKTFSALGGYGMSAITALTAQNTVGVSDIHPVPVDFVEAQIRAVLSDIGADAVKIGMLYSTELIQTVARLLTEFAVPNIVLDPVMVAQSGDKLILDDAVRAIRENLLPLADVVTPNWPEAKVLLEDETRSPSTVDSAAERIAALGAKSVLVKGGHLEGEMCVDVLYIAAADRIVRFETERIDTQNTHGTGCTLSSAIAAHLAFGHPLETAVSNGKRFLTEAIRAGIAYRTGRGGGPVDHLFAFRQTAPM